MKTMVTKRSILLLLADLAANPLSFVAALFLRFDLNVPVRWLSMFLSTWLIYGLISLAIFHRCQLYKYDWRYMTTRNALRIGGAVCISTALYALILYCWRQATFPPAVLFMQILLATLAAWGVRLGVHLWYFWGRRSFVRGAKQALIIGAGDAAEGLVRDMQRRKNSPYSPIGYLDDDPKKQGLLLCRLPVLGKIGDVQSVVKSRTVDEIIIAIPSAKRYQLQSIVAACKITGIPVKQVPSLFAILEGTVGISEIKNVEPEDVLGRELNLSRREDISHCLRGKRILVTGAGGSIGAELCRQIMRYDPGRLVLVDNSEFNLYNIDAELSQDFVPKVHVAVIGDIQSRSGMEQVFTVYQPQVVFHAAAYKHVPLMEENVEAAIKNNVWGTANISWLAAEKGVERLVMISTDKAVNPSNVMGASKRLAEMVVQSMNGASRAKFCAVRFGNVLGSSGSVLPLFKRQIAMGGPVTITHPDVVRYFMTIPEAVQLVLTAAAMAQGGEVYVLEMGAPVKILDMAKSLIRLSGFEPYTDIPIETIGLRPGEKLYEELLTAEEGIQKTHCERIFIGKSGCYDRSAVFADVEQFWHLANARDFKAIEQKLKTLIPGYTGTIGSQSYEPAAFEPPPHKPRVNSSPVSSQPTAASHS